MLDTIPRLVEFELTAACQLSCSHCLTSSHPGAGHGSMTLDDWRRVTDQVAEAGAETIQLIGGEPTASPHFFPLVDYILTEHPGLQVQVYSNLYSVTDRHWAIYEHPQVTLATSYYSDVPAEHDQVTTKAGSHARTRANIIEAVRRGIPLQVGIVRVLAAQRADEAKSELIGLGIPEDMVGIDRARAVGRANPNPGSDAPVSELCGRCGDGRLAILPDGTVAPCVLGRGLRGGNLRTGDALADILTGPTWSEHMRSIPRRTSDPCTPSDSNDCDPARTTACRPAYEYSPPFPTIDLGLQIPLRGTNPCTPATSDGSDCTPASTPACSPSFSTPPPIPPQPK